MKKVIIIIVAGLLGLNSWSQQDPMLSQYMFNGLYLNPAYAGSQNYWTSTLSNRYQWVGFEGAPRTFIAAVDGPIAAKNMGLGMIFFNDQIGVTNQNSFLANYSYKLKINETDKLSFGVSAGASQYSARLTDLTIWDENDPVFQNDLVSRIIPRFGFGMYYTSKDKWYAGFSIPTLLAYQKGKDFTMDLNQATFLNRHYLLTGGYIFPINDNLKFKPSVLFKYLPNAPMQMDLNAGLLLKDMFWIGGSYRTGDAAVFMIEYQTNAFFRIGYSYDMTFSELRKYSTGSHELMIGIDFGKDLVKTKTPRYF
jgi:type IX secretion system PorP/SprF family membrane protein